MPGLPEQLQSSLGATYAVERELGGGGMSRVFVARESALDRFVVVKAFIGQAGLGIRDLLKRSPAPPEK
jgi:serine/threonine-protein kinase